MNPATHRAALLHTIRFHGFRTNEIYPVDLNGDGRFELLALQSPGIYQSAIFNDTVWAVPEREQAICCLTALDQSGTVCWQYGAPYLDAVTPATHVCDQMLCHSDFDGDGRQEVVLLQRGCVVLLRAESGEVLRSVELDADNYAIVLPWQTPDGSRLVVKNTEAAYPPHWYGDPVVILDADLRVAQRLTGIVGSGHSPRTFDLDGDGVDELLVGYEAFDAAGNRLWRLEGQRVEGYDPIGCHLDQLQIGALGGQGERRIVYAGSLNCMSATLDGRLVWARELGHAQHVLIGRFRGEGTQAELAIFNLEVGNALARYAGQSGLALPGARYANGIVWMTRDGEIVDVIYPPITWPASPSRAGGAHSGEGILVYPQVCADGSDAVVVRDCGWPRVYTVGGTEPFVIPYPEDRPAAGSADPVGPDGYGVRIADFDGDGSAEILIHDRTTAWIFAPPFPTPGTPNTHARLQPVTGQGWYAA